MKPSLLIGLTFSFIPLVATASSNGQVPATVQAETLSSLIGKGTLIADARVVPPAFVGKYVGSLKPIAGGCGAAASITIVVARNGIVSSTTRQPYGHDQVNARLSTSINPPLFTGQYNPTSGYQGFWQGQIVGKEIIGRAGISTCRFIFFNLKKV